MTLRAPRLPIVATWSQPTGNGRTEWQVQVVFRQGEQEGMQPQILTMAVAEVKIKRTRRSRKTTRKGR